MDEKVQATISELNRHLEGMPYKLAIVKPGELKLLDKNARYMEEGTFHQLVENIKRDGGPSSLPLCHLDKAGAMEVLSGNHRVKAAKMAGIETIMVMVIDRKLSRGEAVAIQLSHNAIQGKDDMTVLKSLWDEIQDIELRTYAGLDSDVLEELKNLEFVTIGETHLDTRIITLAFLPEDAAELKRALADADLYFQGEENYVLARAHYEKVFNLAADVKEKYNIVSNPIAFMKIVELARLALDEKNA